MAAEGETINKTFLGKKDKLFLEGRGSEGKKSFQIHISMWKIIHKD